MKPINLLTGVLSILNSQHVKILDWLLAIGSVSYGVYCLLISSYDGGVTPYFWIGFGLLGFVLAFKRPSEMVESKVKSTFSKK